MEKNKEEKNDEKETASYVRLHRRPQRASGRQVPMIN